MVLSQKPNKISSDFYL